jgi:hypothetical protein
MTRAMVSGAGGLRTLRGLEALTHVDGDLLIVDNPDLLSLEGLSGLVSVSGDVTIIGNGPSNGTLDICTCGRPGWRAMPLATDTEAHPPWSTAGLSSLQFVGGTTTIQGLVSYGTPIPACPCKYSGTMTVKTLLVAVVRTAINARAPWTRPPGLLCTVHLTVFEEEVAQYVRYISYNNLVLLTQSLLCTKYLVPTTPIQVNVCETHAQT